VCACSTPQDPAGFTSDGDEAAFNRRRAVEIKHGRISMLATIGYIVPDLFRLPGYISPSQNLKFADIPNGLGALKAVPGNHSAHTTLLPCCKAAQQAVHCLCYRCL
jgi:Chlorophyll A-B binding protein